MTELHLAGKAERTAQPAERTPQGLLPPVVLDDDQAKATEWGWSPTEWRRGRREHEDR